ncbi:MAG TPA: hypothetical protein VJU79_02260, partial [Candidatus Dormibacteraeota bacterium]|nr:hypothetical protein [Candidatus Dormibacteraeota bacterium]
MRRIVRQPCRRRDRTATGCWERCGNAAIGELRDKKPSRLWRNKDMATLEKKSLDQPDETRLPLKTTVQLVS